MPISDYLNEIKQITLKYLQDEPVKVFVFGSVATNTIKSSSDIDIGIIPKSQFDKQKLSDLQENLEESNIPYKVDIVDFSNVSKDFSNLALKEIIIWKD